MKINKNKSLTVITKNNFSLKGIKAYVLIAVCGIMAVINIFLTIDSSTNGSEIVKLQDFEEQLLSQQLELQQTLVKSLSVNSLQEKSLGLGYTKVTNLVYITSSEYVANAESIINSEPVAKLP